MKLGGKQGGVRTGFVTLVNARQKGTAQRDTAAGGARIVRMPVADNVNGGAGVHFYLSKRDEGSGKPIFYQPEVWASMNEVQRADALDFKPIADESHKAVASNLINAFMDADPLAKKALIDSLAPMIRAQLEGEKAAPAKEKKP